MTNGNRGQRGFRPNGPTIGNFQPIAARSFCLVGGPRGRGGWRLLSGSPGKGPGRDISVGRENEFSSEVSTEEAVPALRGGPRGVEGRPGRAPSGPRLPAAAALPGWLFTPPRRERSLARFPSFVSGARAWPSPSWGSRGPARFLPVRALRWPTWVGLVSSIPSGHVRTPHSPLAPHPVHLQSVAQGDAGVLGGVWRVARAATFIPEVP